MNPLFNIANALIKWSNNHPATSPLVLSAARDILLLAEADNIRCTMTKTAAKNVSGMNLLSTLRHTPRPVHDLLRSVQSQSLHSTPSKDALEAAADRLLRLAEVADVVDVALADESDKTISKIYAE